MSSSESRSDYEPESATGPGSRSGHGRFTPDEKIVLMHRIKKGETQASIARDVGVTRQYVSLLWKAYQESGEDGIRNTRTRGRPLAKRMSDRQSGRLRKLIQRSMPVDHGIKGTGENAYWTIHTAQLLAAKEFGFPPPKVQLRGCLEMWGIPPLGPRPYDDDLEDEEFLAWLKSPAAKELKRREDAQKKEIEERIKRRKTD